MTLQDLSHRCGVSVSTLNYYTNVGLLQVADRQGNRRLYREAQTLRQLDKIQRLRREGYPLRIIRTQLREGKAG